MKKLLLVAMLLLALPVMVSASEDLRGDLHKVNFEEAVAKSVLRGEAVVEKTESEELSVILSELKDLKVEVEEMTTEEFVNQSSELKEQARDIVSRFRELAQTLVVEEDRLELRKEMTSELLEEYKEKRMEIRNELQANLVERKLEMLNATDSELLAQIRAGELTVAELRLRVRDHILEARQGRLERVQERVEERRDAMEDRREERRKAWQNDSDDLEDSDEENETEEEQ